MARADEREEPLESSGARSTYDAWGSMEASRSEDFGLMRANRPVLTKAQAGAIAVGVFFSTTLVSGALFTRLRQRELSTATNDSVSPMGSAQPVNRVNHCDKVTGPASGLHAAALRAASLALVYGTLLCACGGYIGWRVLLWYTGTRDLESFASAMRSPESVPSRLRRRLEQGSLGRSLRSWNASMEAAVSKNDMEHLDASSSQTNVTPHGLASWLHRIAAKTRESVLVEWLRRRTHRSTADKVDRNPVQRPQERGERIDSSSQDR